MPFDKLHKHSPLTTLDTRRRSTHLLFRCTPPIALGQTGSVADWLTLLARLFLLWLKTSGPSRSCMAGICASVVVIVFMMSNVMIFAPQLYFLMWALVGISTAIERDVARAAEVRT